MANIGLQAGHNYLTGARALDNTDEWTFNSKVNGHLSDILTTRGHKVVGFVRDPKLGYTSAMRKLARQVKRAKCVLVLELHFNASRDPSHNGFEYLHWWRSMKSTLLAQCLGDQQHKHFPDIKQRGTNRGARSLWYHRWNADKAYSRNGGGFCYLLPCPCVICEPGFATNVSDWYTLRESAYDLALSYADGIDLYLQTV